MDYFALLGQPRQPWLDADSLKAAFLQQSARLHPDRVLASDTTEQAAATERFAELNAAYNCLREPKDRLLHLLEFETGAPPANVQSVPADTMDLLMETGEACRQTDQFLAAKSRAASPLAKAQIFEQALEWTTRLQALQERIQLRHDQLLAESRAMNDAWNAAPPAPSPLRAGALPLRRLEELGRTLSYIARCAGQIQERLAQLSF
ncbi:MAG TPA: DnaJ domain-containing protein [Verrucomicrobiae bacterium]|jgi:curved DNA-binding protein CbpA|nr:DnaJ domain-containing protein [Verrucomicrobiae bacterium]